MEGFPGFFVAVTAAVYVFLKYAKLREHELRFDHAHRPEFTEGKEQGGGRGG